MHSIDNNRYIAGSWDGFLQQGYATSMNGVVANSFPREENVMRASHAILALRQIAFQSVEEPLFYCSRAKLSVRGRLVGYVEIKKETASPRRVQTPEEGKIAGNNLTADEVAPQSGTIRFGDLPMSVPWKVVGGKVNSKAMLAAMVDGLVKIASIDSDLRICEWLSGVGSPSSAGQVVITIGSDGELDYGMVKYTLSAVFEQLNIGQNIWHEMGLEFFLADIQVGEGHIDLLPPLSLAATQ